MDSKFFKTGILIPLIAALAAGLIVFFAVKANTDSIMPFQNGSAVMSFDNLSSDEKDAARDAKSLEDGALIGTIKGNEALNLIYNGGYSCLLNGASLSGSGALPGEDGTAYIRIINTNADKLGDDLEISGFFGDIKYKKAEEKTVNNENEVFLSAKRGEALVVYFNQRVENGLSSRYTVIIYEEAA